MFLRKAELAQQQFFYGGQAVIEGVMIRGRHFFSLAVRRLDGSVYTTCERLNPFYAGRLRRVPLIRGVLALIETLVLGIKALNRSATLAMEDQSPEEKEIPRWLLGLTLGISLTLGVALFFIMPLIAVSSLDRYITSDLLSNLVEGLIRILVLGAYVGLIGLLPDIRRVFAYHGAEHMAVHTHEAGAPLVVHNVRQFPTAHPRCGTAFLLTVMVVAIILFALLGRPSMELRILSRIVLIPVIAAISYEIIRFSGAHQASIIGKVVSYPGLMLQRLTTRNPDDQQIEVAISAMKSAITADEDGDTMNDVGRAEEGVQEPSMLAEEAENSGN